MKYRVFALLGMMALGAGAFLQAQDYDDIYYDASKSTTAVKTAKSEKTQAVYGKVPEKYKVAVQDNYRVERDVDEYNRRGEFEPTYEVDINGDTIYEDAFANTRRIERFYNPDIVILSDDDDLVELYYDESPTINLIVGSDWGIGSYYGWGYSSYYPWYTGWYEPWYTGFGWYSPWRYWHTPWYYGSYYRWGYGYYHPGWYYGSWDPYWRWGHNYSHGWYGYHGWDKPHRYNAGRYVDNGGLRTRGQRTGLSAVRGTHTRTSPTTLGTGRSGIATQGVRGTRTRSTGVAPSGSRTRTGVAATRTSGNMGTRTSSGVTTRTRTSSSSYSGGRSSSPSHSYSGSSRSSSSSSSRSSGSYSSGGSRSGSYSGGGGSHGGGSRGGSSGGGGRRR